jgi:hypothetical protein
VSSIPPEVTAAAESALREFCNRHSSAAIADQLRYSYELSGATALLVEQRPGFMNPSEWVSSPKAKFRYSATRRQWSLYWSDSNERWRRLSSAPAANDISTLLKIVADDPAGVFWG